MGQRLSVHFDKKMLTFEATLTIHRLVNFKKLRTRLKKLIIRSIDDIETIFRKKRLLGSGFLKWGKN